jgi:fucose 4-O-acetylase-like acetyltransferase
VDDPGTTPVADVLIGLLDLFVMPALFFISGFVTPRSLATKNAAGFLKSRARRLLLPWLIAILTLIPLYKLIFLHSRNIPQEHWTTYFHWHALWGQNWLWFLPVLFLFNVLYLVASRARIMPARVSLKGAVAAIFLTGWAYSCGVDLFGLRGWTHTLVLDFQNERLLLYFMLFVLGAACARQNALAARSRNRTSLIAIAATASVAVTLYYCLYKRSVDTPSTETFAHVADTALLWFVFHAALLSALYITLAVFRYFLNRHNALSRVLSRNSYYVYIIHTIVLGGIATALLDTTLPALWKYAIVTVATYVICQVVVAGCRRLIEAWSFTRKPEVRAMKAVTQTLLIVALTAVCGCGKQAGSSSAARPPHVDIHIAALQGHIDAIRQHISAGSNLDERDQYGSSPLIIAVTFGQTDVARALLEAGADTEVRNNDGATALHIGAFLCRNEIVEMLLDHGADRNAVNASGRTALDAVSGPFEDVKRIYDQLGASLKPLGLRLDYERIKRARPRIARVLREA